MTLTKTRSTANGEEYAGSDGDRYLLRAVNRQYAGTVKKPLYYLERWTDGKWQYLSGLFPTGRAGVFSMDLRDGIGVRKLYTLTVTDGGERAELTEGKRGRRHDRKGTKRADGVTLL